MPGDNLAGQPLGQRLPHHEPHAIPVRSRTTRTISCIVVPVNPRRGINRVYAHQTFLLFALPDRRI
jgi:hypothetical protein